MAKKPPVREPRETKVSNMGEITIQYSGRPPFLIDQPAPSRDPSKEPTAVRKSVAQIQKEALSKEACLVVIYGPDLGRKFTLTNQSLTVGRVDGCDIQLDEGEVSRNHCTVAHREGQVIIHDLASTNGTYVNDKLVEVSPIQNGDLIRIGGTILKFLASGSLESTYHEELFNLTTRDGLTQTHNKRFLLDSLQREVGRSKRYGRPLSLLMMDIDHFKLVNDVFGHLAGDHVLKHLVKVILEQIREQDIMARFGGEEFVVILPEIGFQGSITCAERIRHLVEETRFIYDGSKIPVNVSIGLVSSKKGSHDADDMLRIVDANLYEAKRRGRNQIHGSEAT